MHNIASLRRCTPPAGAVLAPALLLILCCLLVLQPVRAAPTGEGVGRIVFAIGPVHVVTEGERREVVRGARVYEGDRVITGTGGNAQIRFADGGFLGLRPESTVRIHVYRPGGEGADDVRIRMDVDRGNVRSVTGTGGERNPDGFRLDTPVAAVGVRGTDFTVRADQRRTRVQVSAGGVSVSPFTANCERGGVGACRGEGSRTLFARDAERRVLEVVRGADRARIVEQGRASSQSPAPQRAEPEGDAGAADDEAQAVGGEADTGSTSTADAAGETDPASTSTADAAGESDPASTSTVTATADPDNNAESAINDADGSRTANEALDEAERTARQREQRRQERLEREQRRQERLEREQRMQERFEAVRDDITWGRWSRIAGDRTTVTEARRDDQTVMTFNRVFGLLTPDWLRNRDRALPDSGRVSFNPGSSEAVLLANGDTTPATVASPELTVDFARRLFQTRLEVDAEQLDAPAAVEAQGSVDEFGRMSSNDSESNARVSGIVAPDGRQAGMLFERALEEGVTAAGAIDWFR